MDENNIACLAQFQERGGNSAKPTEQADVRIEDFVAYMPMHNYIFNPRGSCGRQQA